MWGLALLLAAIVGVVLLPDKKGPQKEKVKRRANHRRKKNMADKKVVFIAFAIEDKTARDLLVGQSLNTKTPFEFIDMSVTEPYDEAWKAKVRTRIKRSDGLIALVSKNSLNSSGQKWEISCGKEEGKKILGIWAYTDDRTGLAAVNTVPWTWDAITKFIESI
jgi:hypothetical protein